jgi:hypothetical protein
VTGLGPEADASPAKGGDGSWVTVRGGGSGRLGLDRSAMQESGEAEAGAQHDAGEDARTIPQQDEGKVVKVGARSNKMWDRLRSWVGKNREA